MQEYVNAGSVAIEAKYVFPLEEGASVYVTPSRGSLHCLRAVM